MSYEESQARYTFIRTHYQGETGSISVMRDTLVGREIALKRLELSPPKDGSFRNMFLREARTTGQLEHPNIVPVYDIEPSHDSEEPYYTMRLVHGETLSEHIRRFHAKMARKESTRLDLNLLLNIFVSIGHAIAYAHSQGVLHLDLKPANIMLGKFGEVVVLDWGLARILETVAPSAIDTLPGEPAGSSSRVIMGTPVYMAPEQMKGTFDDIGPATDVYGLGGILHEILTGQPPHPLAKGSQADSEAVTINEAKEIPKREESLHTLRACRWIPKSLKAVCAHALMRSPRDRYAQVEEMVADIQAWLADESVSVYRAPVQEKVLRWVRRNRVLTATGTCLCLFAILFGVNLFRLTVLDRQDQLINTLALEVKESQEPLRALKNYLEMEGKISRDRFRDFVQPYLHLHQELQAIEWIPRVYAHQRADFEAEALSDDISDFQFTELSESGEMVPVQERELYYPVYYVEPLASNRKALGYDLGSSALRLDALNTAWERGSITASHPIDLVQARENKKGILIFAPLFLEDSKAQGRGEPVKGFALGVYKVDDLLRIAWDNVPMEHIAVEVYDVSRPEAPVFLWRNMPGPPQLEKIARSTQNNPFRLNSTSREIKAWNRTWKVCMRVRGRFLLYYPTSR